MHNTHAGHPIGSVFFPLAVGLALLSGAVACDSSKSDEDKDAGKGRDASVKETDGAVKDGGACTSSKDSGRIYVAISGNNEIAVIDDKCQKIISTIAVGTGPAIVLATPDFSKLYTANWTDNTVSSVDVAKEKSTSIDLLGGRPYVIAMSADGKYLYAGLNTNRIAVINTEADQTVERYIDTPDIMPASISVSSDGKTLYVAELTKNTLRALSAVSGEILHEPIAVGTAPAWITISPDGSTVYTLNYNSDNVSVVDTKTFAVTAAIATGQGSKAIIGKVTPDGSMLYVTNLGTGNLMAFDTKNNQEAQTIPLDGRPVGLAFNKDSTRVYGGDYGEGSLDSPTSAGREFLLTGKFTSTRKGRVNVFDTSTGKRVGSAIEVGPGPSSMVVNAP